VIEALLSSNEGTIWLAAKLGTLLLLAIYIVFAFVVLRQVSLMTQTLEVGFEKALRTIALAHLILSIAIFLFALVIL